MKKQKTAAQRFAEWRYQDTNWESDCIFAPPTPAQKGLDYLEKIGTIPAE